MAFSAQRALEIVEHTLGTKQPQLGLTIINDAGRELCNMHSWRFLLRPAASLNLIADQDFVSLPADFGSIISVQRANFPNSICLTTVDNVAQLRALNTAMTTPYEWQAALSSRQDAAGGAPTDVLELWPTPAVTDPDGITLYYRAKWMELETDTDYAAIPVELETLYGEMVRAFARGYEEEDQETLSERVARIMMGPIYLSAKKSDGRKQRYWGVPRGGLGQTMAGGSWIPQNSATFS
jgi:hypothetical protein